MFIRCFNCGEVMQGIRDSAARDICVDCGGECKTSDTPEREAARAELAAIYAAVDKHPLRFWGSRR